SATRFIEPVSVSCAEQKRTVRKSWLKIGWRDVGVTGVSSSLAERVYPWGNKFQPNRTNLWQGEFPRVDTAEDGYHGVSPVAAFPPQNSYGLYDLLGNTWEWTASEYPSAGLSAGRRAQQMRVLRGASWVDTADGSANHRARVTTRMGNTPDSASDNLSFRCAADVLPVTAQKSQRTKPEL
ncbi:PREDICTED: sulfatase-modifying factor 2-like, partial [Pterocles gutturalis]|uniref:sulfatase-modifying factor 2-like n=1 Tax=Pterocles gutturalis TaxID=240206 RepID=UPI00052802AA